MSKLFDIEFNVDGGFYPSSSDFPPASLLNTLKAGSGMWVRAGNQLQIANGAAQTSSTNVGARIFPFNNYRAEIAGALVARTNNPLPFAGLIRYQNACIFFLSELTSQQVYINESTSATHNMSGVTTASSAGILRVAVPIVPATSPPSYNTYDAGFSKPATGTVGTTTGGTKGMTGSTGVALAPWRTATNAIGPPSETTYQTLTPTTADKVTIVLPAAVSGQDGWIFGGTRWGDQSGEIRVVRYVYIVPRGTFDITIGGTMTGSSATRWNRDLRVGDVVNIGGNTGTVATITSDSAATLSGWGGGALSGQTMTITTACAEWYNSELGSLIDRDAQKPPKAAGVFQFAGSVFIWGCYGESSGVSGPAILPMLENNPEHVGLTVILTSQNDDLVNVLAGDQTLFLMTTNTLELVTFTGDPNVPYKVRAYDGVSGFTSAANGVVYKNRFYGFQQRPIRTVTDQDIDVEFARPVWRTMQQWVAQNIVLAVDPQNEAVLFCHYNGTTETTVLPFLAQLGIWSLPIKITGQVVDYVVIGGACYLIVLTGGNYRVYQWEGGNGATDPYFGTQYFSSPDRHSVKGIVYTGRGTAIRVYVAEPGEIPPDVATAGSAEAVYNITDTNQSQLEIFTNLPPARALALRVDFGSVSSILPQFQRIIARAMRLVARR